MRYDDLYDPLLGNEVLPSQDEIPSRSNGISRFRLIIYSLMMLTILIISSFLTAATALPSLLGYWQNHYQIRITDIDNGECGQTRNNSRGLIVADKTYCVCGILDAGVDTADFSLNLHKEKGQRLGVIHLREQPSGHFCQTFNLDNRLAIGDYEIRVMPRLSRQTIYGIRFRVEDPNPTI